MGVIQSSQGNLQPASSELLSEPAIVARLATATLGTRTQVRWLSIVENYDLIRDLIEQVVPGFEQYNERVRKPGGFYLPNEPRQGSFPTRLGKARFTVHPLPDNYLEPGQLLMTTIRSHDQFNTTVYSLNDRYRGIHNGRRVVFMNEEDILEQGLAAGQAVDLTSYFQGQKRVARRFFVVPYDIPRRSAATYFPEGNVLVPIGSVAEMSNTPTSKSIVIQVTPAVG
jgi:anaerobic selenocysteine-containing dehydrogenase